MHNTNPGPTTVLDRPPVLPSSPFPVSPRLPVLRALRAAGRSGHTERRTAARHHRLISATSFACDAANTALSVASWPTVGLWPLFRKAMAEA